MSVNKSSQQCWSQWFTLYPFLDSESIFTKAITTKKNKCRIPTFGKYKHNQHNQQNPSQVIVIDSSDDEAKQQITTKQNTNYRMKQELISKNKREIIIEDNTVEDDRTWQKNIANIPQLIRNRSRKDKIILQKTLNLLNRKA